MSSQTKTNQDGSSERVRRGRKGKKRDPGPSSSTETTGNKRQGSSNSGDEHASKRSKSSDGSSNDSFKSADEMPGLNPWQRENAKKLKDLQELLDRLEQRDIKMGIKTPEEEKQKAAAEAAKEAARNAPTRPPFKRYNFEKRPILSAEEVPADWHHEDTDIDEYDIDAMIQRCEERIHDAVLPKLWEEKLEQYKEMKANREAAENKPDAAFGVPILARLNVLTAALKHIEEWGDVFHQKRNIEGIMKAYRSFDLWYTPGLVTYWYKGRQIGGPEKFEWSAYLEYYNDHNGKEVCIEGIDQFTLNNSMAHRDPEVNFKFEKDPWIETEGLVKPRYTPHNHWELSFKSPFLPASTACTRDFLDDTGATFPHVLWRDLADIEHLGQGAPFMTWAHTQTAQGTVLTPVVMLEFNIKWPPNQVELTQGRRMAAKAYEYALDHWYPLAVTVFGTRRVDSVQRLSGLWVHRLFYTARAPDNEGALYVNESHEGLRNALPDINNLDVILPDQINGADMDDYLDRGLQGDFLSPLTSTLAH
ncbi:hypothetical protein N7488_001461 [Penicillium malachiteum]|nr:hypothetical protein N7488_001461 [Penicillium malachiteum]